MVYTMSNASTRNVIEGYSSRHGTLQRIVSIDARGRGDPSIAGAVQGSIATDAGNRFLFAVDAGSNEISSFGIDNNGLTFIGKTGSNGSQPVSLTVHDDLLYVLNAGSGTITGFRISSRGVLRPIANSTKPISGSNAGPAEISFDSSGKVLVVTEKTTNKIDTYSVTDGIPHGPTVHRSVGKTPFGFAFAPNSEVMVVADAFMGEAGSGAASSYSVTAPDTLTLISGKVGDQNTSPCWVVITADGRVSFTSNTGSDTISSYKVDAGGALALSVPNGVSARTGSGPTDLALSPDDKFLFVINLKSQTLGSFRVTANGNLGPIKDAPRLPAHSLGLVALPNVP
jgi:hypothetical protein